jgi:hypothetical protein
MALLRRVLSNNSTSSGEFIRSLYSAHVVLHQPLYFHSPLHASRELLIHLDW